MTISLISFSQDVNKLNKNELKVVVSQKNDVIDSLKQINIQLIKENNDVLKEMNSLKSNIYTIQMKLDSIEKDNMKKNIELNTVKKFYEDREKVLSDSISKLQRFNSSQQTAYQNPSQEDKYADDDLNKAVIIANIFMRSVYESSVEKVDSLLTGDYAEIQRNYKNRLSRKVNPDFNFEAKRIDGEKIIVDAIGQSQSVLGSASFLQKIILKKINDNWKIDDSYNLIHVTPNFSIEGIRNAFDSEKIQIIKDVEKNMSFEILQSGQKRKYSDDVIAGKLRIYNNTEYDIKSLDLTIEHFDYSGSSVNTDNITVYEVIKSKGYKDEDWSTFDCGNCVRQEIKFDLYKKK
jgi:hypothetical protein